MKNRNLHHFSRFTDKEPSTVERVIRTTRNLLKNPVFEKGKADWLSELPSVIRRHNNTIHSSKKMKPIDDSKTSTEKKSLPTFMIEEIDKHQSLN